MNSYVNNLLLFPSDLHELLECRVIASSLEAGARVIFLITAVREGCFMREHCFLPSVYSPDFLTAFLFTAQRRSP